MPIRKKVIEMTGKEWSFGAVYDPLDRLEKKGYLESGLSNPSPRRGGKSKRMYNLTKHGLQELVAIRNLQESVWRDVPKEVLERQI